MFDRPKYVIATLLLFLLFGGSGCVAVPVSDASPEEAANALSLFVGSEILIRPTILGVGGSIVDWLGGEQEVRQVAVIDWLAGESVSLSWNISTQVETEASKKIRSDYEATYAQSPVGVEIPPVPEPEYENRIVEGVIASTSLNNADMLMLPEAWPEGEGGNVQASLIWFSREHYDELIQTRSTIVSLGLFDESLMKVEDATHQIETFMDTVTSLISPFVGSDSNEETPIEETPSETDSLIRIEANPAWGEYILLVDGVRTTVRVVEAENAFARYKILANPENPLVLEIQLTPLSQGNLELLSLDGLARGFGGYEITQINTKTGQ
ncbi:hypothetical protein HQ487_02385 [Candidatus Uhrbacteria bacterium]|nr:hypothetical protein [Candidatus Uhrbacteria bacterium]